MSKKKQQIREDFRNKVFIRDNYSCKKCGVKFNKETAKEGLDAHHITDRNLMPNGGYVPENGISLCKVGEDCHFKAESFHISGTSLEGYSPEDLYKLINSSYDKAFKASQKNG